ncbi:sensor domain-containing protein [Donghicola tyrosinivorans]|nr:EAL domain-containing protein [Donghicola tyrosinivorans]
MPQPLMLVQNLVGISRLFLLYFTAVPLVCVVIDVQTNGLTPQTFGLVLASFFSLLFSVPQSFGAARQLLLEASLFGALVLVYFAFADWGLMAGLAQVMGMSFGYGCLRRSKARAMAVVGFILLAASPLQSPDIQPVHLVLYLIGYGNMVLLAEWTRTTINQQRRQMSDANDDLARVNQQLQRTRHLSRAYLEHTNAGVIIRDPDLRVLEFNKPATELFDFLGLELCVGSKSRVSDADPERFEVIVDQPDDSVPALKAVGNHKASITCPNGETRHFIFSVGCIEADEEVLWLSSWNDITETVLTEELMRKRQNELTALFDNQSVPAAVWRLGPEIELAYMNSAYMGLDGAVLTSDKAETLQGKCLEKVFRPNYVSVAKLNLKRILNALEAGTQSLVLPKQDHQNGRRYQVEFSLVTITADKNERFIVLNYVDVTVIEKTRAGLEKQLMVDDLTGVLSRRGINHHCETRGKEDQALFLIDLDQFKSVNDGYGHDVGDRLLASCGGVLSDLVDDHGVAGRLGGEEFVIIRPMSDWDEISSYAEKIRASIAALELETEDGSLSRSASIGVSAFKSDDSLSDALAQADVALVDSKRSGRDKVTLATPAYIRKCEEEGRFVTERDIYDALVNKEMYYAVQPIMNTKRNNISGFEALIRWERADGTTISPSTFSSRLYEAVKNPEFRELMLDLRLRTVRDLTYFDDRYISFNHHVEELNTAGASRILLDQFSSIRDVPGRIFVIELSEKALTERVDMGSVIRNLQDLRREGILIALDDFGIQASNLNRLAELPIDVIKLDKSLVQRVVSDNKTLEVVRSTAIMAGKLGIKTIAEGIETPAQGRMIHHMSSVEQQGFLHGRPMKTSDVFDNLIKIGYDLRSPLHLGY